MERIERALLSLLLPGALLVSLSGTARADSVEAGRQAPVYASPDEESRVIARVRPGAALQILQRRDRWIKVRAGGRVGWVARASLAAVELEASLDRPARRRAAPERRSSRRRAASKAPRERTQWAAAAEPADVSPPVDDPIEAAEWRARRARRRAELDRRRRDHGDSRGRSDIRERADVRERSNSRERGDVRERDDVRGRSDIRERGGNLRERGDLRERDDLTAGAIDGAGDRADPADRRFEGEAGGDRERSSRRRESRAIATTLARGGASNGADLEDASFDGAGARPRGRTDGRTGDADLDEDSDDESDDDEADDDESDEESDDDEADDGDERASANKRRPQREVATVKVAEARIYEERSSRSRRIDRVPEGTRLFVIERDDKWIKVETETGDVGWVRRSKVTDTGGGAPVAATQTTAKLTRRASAGIGYSSISQRFFSKSDDPRATYNLSSGAAVLGVSGELVYDDSDRWLLAGDLTYRYSHAAPGVRYTDPETMIAADIGFKRHQLGVGARAGYELGAERLATVYGRLGLLYDNFRINDVNNFDLNLARLPSEVLTGITVGAMLDVPRLGEKWAGRLQIETLPLLAGRKQTAGLEDGASSKTFAAWGGALVEYAWNETYRVTGEYQYAYARTTWQGVKEGSMRPHMADSARRKDGTHVLLIGLGRSF
jgi:SH3-like domain-containing protein